MKYLNQHGVLSLEELEVRATTIDELENKTPQAYQEHDTRTLMASQSHDQFLESQNEIYPSEQYISSRDK